MHLTPDLLDALADDTCPPQLLEEVQLDHLAALCRTCRRHIRMGRKRPAEPFFSKLAESLIGRPPTQDEIAQARRERATLRRLPSHEKRLARAEGASSWFRSPVLVALYLAEARERVRHDPDAAFELAELAVAFAQHGGAAADTPGCLPLALAHAGNACRAAGELTDAEAFFQRAFQAFERQPDVPTWVRAELASLDGSLLKDRRDFESARDALDAALCDFKTADDAAGAVRVLMKLASLCRLRGDYPCALSTLRQALEHIDAHASPSLHLRAVHNLALYLCEGGQPAAARQVLDFLEPLYERFPETRPRALWLRGVVARDSGDLESAEQDLQRALRLFQTQGSAPYAGLVALDLAELLLMVGRPHEVAPVAAALPPLFRRQGVHREATAAIVLFHRAAKELTLSRELVARYRGLLLRARTDSSAWFPHPE